MADSALVSIHPALMDGLVPLDSLATDWESLTMLYGLVVYLRPKVIVEAGTYYGHFSVVVARLLTECEVWTADPYTRMGESSTLPNLHFVRDDFDAMLAANPELRGQVDFAFIDSGPEQSATEPGMRWRHWTTCKPYMRPGGIMACHDINTAQTWEHGTAIAQESLRLNGGRGLCLWQAP